MLMFLRHLQCGPLALSDIGSFHCDRRSAVSRQACHLISVLAEHMGARLEAVAMAFLPALFKVVVITVQASHHPRELHQ